MTYYTDLNYKPRINNELVVGDKSLLIYGVNHQLIAKPQWHTQITELENENSKDVQSVLNITNVENFGVTCDSQYQGAGEEVDPACIELERENEQAAPVIKLINGYAYKAGEDFEDDVDEGMPEEVGEYTFNLHIEGKVSVVYQNEGDGKGQVQIGFKGTCEGEMFLGVPMPIPPVEHCEYFTGDGTKENPLKLNVEKIAAKVKEYNLKR
jgi:hypothetical protein